MNNTSSPIATGIAGLGHKGNTWNESTLAPDPVTGRPVRRLTDAGDQHQFGPGPMPSWNARMSARADCEKRKNMKSRTTSSRDGAVGVHLNPFGRGVIVQIVPRGLGGLGCTLDALAPRLLRLPR